MIPKEDGMGLSKGASQMVEPSAPPMYEEHETPPPTYDQVFSAEDKGDPTPMPGAEDCKCEITTNKKKEAAKHLGPWKSADIGEPVDDSKDPILTKRKRRRKVKKDPVNMGECSSARGDTSTTYTEELPGNRSTQLVRHNIHSDSDSDTDVDDTDVGYVVDHKRLSQRHAIKAMGWTFWIVCPVLAWMCNCIRERPVDEDDVYDWNDDPLRPWNYKVDLDVIRYTDEGDRQE